MFTTLLKIIIAIRRAFIALVLPPGRSAGDAAPAATTSRQAGTDEVSQMASAPREHGTDNVAVNGDLVREVPAPSGAAQSLPATEDGRFQAVSRQSAAPPDVGFATDAPVVATVIPITQTDENLQVEASVSEPPIRGLAGAAQIDGRTLVAGPDSLLSSSTPEYSAITSPLTAVAVALPASPMPSKAAASGEFSPMASPVHVERMPEDDVSTESDDATAGAELANADGTDENQLFAETTECEPHDRFDEDERSISLPDDASIGNAPDPLTAAFPTPPEAASAISSVRNGGADETSNTDVEDAIASSATLLPPSSERGLDEDPSPGELDDSVGGGSKVGPEPLSQEDLAESEVPPTSTTSGRRPSSKGKTRQQYDNATSRRKSPQDWSQPFSGGQIGTAREDYTKWNRAVVQNALQTHTAGSDLLLSITPRVLAGAWLEWEGAALTPEEAVERFVAAVSTTYSTRVLTHRAKLQTLRRCGDNGLPECAAFLALTVLAAYEMHAEEGVGAAAYYQRLEQLLRCGMTGGMPRGFDGDQFEALWMFFGAWLREQHNQRLAMPGTTAGLRRFVALPLTHVPLRRVDIERLPDFFEWAGLAPGEKASAEKVALELHLWARARGGFTVAGREALRDERRAAVIAQIAHELESWDGSLTDASGGHAATVEVFLNWERRVPCLWYLPRRPADFPVTFDDGEHLLDSGYDGWYEPIPLEPSDGPALRGGMSWRMTAGDAHFVLRRAGVQVLALTPSEFDGPMSHGSLVLGAPCAVMCVDEIGDGVAHHLEAITGKRSVAINAPSVPVGWRLFTSVVPVRRIEPPVGLEVLAIKSAVDVIPRGGLRLGRRWSWLVGAPPTLIVTGLQQGDSILLNDELVHVDAEGAVQDEGRLSRPGVHVLRAGHALRRIEIVEPETPAVELLLERDNSPRHAAALPTGKWTVLGARPGDVAYASSGRWGAGAFATSSFAPVWAVSYSGGPGAAVMLLAPVARGPEAVESRSHEREKATAVWANAIHGAQVRRPSFLSSASELDSTLRTQWMAYVGAARRIKRTLKAAQR